MKKLVTLFSIIALRLLANSEYEYPKLYQGLWPNFCLEHLQTTGEICSETLIGTEYYYCYYSPEEEQAVYDIFFDEDGNACKLNPPENIDDDEDAQAVIEEPEGEWIDIGDFSPFSFCICTDQKHLDELDNSNAFLPSGKNNCAYMSCNVCNKPVLKSLGIYSDSDFNIAIQYNCDCCFYPIVLDSSNYKMYKDLDWSNCNSATVPFAYFNRFNSKYLPFFRNHLLYTNQNPYCSCYWPHVSKIACQISDIVYDNMRLIFKTETMSELLPQKELCKLEESADVEQFENYSIAKNEFVLRAMQNHFIFSFFYSNYHTAIINLCNHVDAHSINIFRDIATTLLYSL